MIINHHNRGGGGGGGGVGEWTNVHIKLHLQLPHTITRYQVVVTKSPDCPSLPVRVACTAFMALACQSGLERLV